MLNWTDFLKAEFKQDYFGPLSETLKEAYTHKTVYPMREQVFNAFAYAEYAQLKVVLIGQDPYYQPGQAHGLCFSVNPGVPFPPSLQNIFKELQSDIACPQPQNGCLIPWAKQGVLLLNSLLTVEEGKPLSHQGIGWESFFEHAMQACNAHPQPLVFILWGKNAQAKADLITDPKHLILKAPHPSPLSAYNGFFGSKPFSKTNAFLKENGREPIDWCL